MKRKRSMINIWKMNIMKKYALLVFVLLLMLFFEYVMKVSQDVVRQKKKEENKQGGPPWLSLEDLGYGDEERESPIYELD